MPEITPSRELTKEEQARELMQSPLWRGYVIEVEKMIASITTSMDVCKPEEIARLQGMKLGLKTALNLISEK